MSCHPRVTEWTTIIQTHLPHLSKPQATVLALWSLGMVLARSCALTAVSAFLAPWLGRKEPAVRQQLREFCYEASAKRGTTRCAAYRRRTNIYAKNTGRLQEGLDVYWIVHNFVRVHFTTRQVPAVALGVLESGLSLHELFFIQKVA